MTRAGAARRVAISLLILLAMAACTEVRAAEPFPAVSMPPVAKRSYGWAYVSLVTGAGLIGSSFALSNRADDIYRDYLGATEPRLIEQLYDRTVLYDRLSSGALLGGEALVVLGVYLRFIRRPTAARLSLRLEPARCALAFSF